MSKKRLILAVCVVLGLSGIAVVAQNNAEVGSVKVTDLEGPITTDTVKLAVFASRACWQRAQDLCHDHLTSAIANSAYSDAIKISYIRAIPTALKNGGPTAVWQAGNQILRKAMMASAADALETEAAALEARASILRRFATGIDNHAAAYTTDMEPIFSNN